MNSAANKIEGIASHRVNSNSSNIIRLIFSSPFSSLKPRISLRCKYKSHEEILKKISVFSKPPSHEIFHMKNIYSAQHVTPSGRLHSLYKLDSENGCWTHEMQALKIDTSFSKISMACRLNFECCSREICF